MTSAANHSFFNSNFFNLKRLYLVLLYFYRSTTLLLLILVILYNYITAVNIVTQKTFLFYNMGVQYVAISP